MKKENVKAIREAKNQKEANEFLDEGFELIDIKMVKTNEADIEQQRPIYILVHTLSNKEIKKQA